MGLCSEPSIHQREEHASLLLSGWKERDKTEKGEGKDIRAWRSQFHRWQEGNVSTGKVSPWQREREREVSTRSLVNQPYSVYTLLHSWSRPFVQGGKNGGALGLFPTAFPPSKLLIVLIVLKLLFWKIQGFWVTIKSCSSVIQRISVWIIESFTNDQDLFLSHSVSQCRYSVNLLLWMGQCKIQWILSNHN